MEFTKEMQSKVIHGECLEVLKKGSSNAIDTIITDPPYGLSFMGKKRDYDVPSVEIRKQCFRVLKPGGTALIFAGSRTQHRMACNVEDAGFILKDTIMRMYGSGFPKATDISRQLMKNAGDKGVVIGQRNPFSDGGERKSISKGEQGANHRSQDIILKDGMVDVIKPTTPEAKLRDGRKSHGLKPSYEPIIVAMKPNEGSYANNALKRWVSGLWIEGGRIGTIPRTTHKDGNIKGKQEEGSVAMGRGLKDNYIGEVPNGRFPANTILTHHHECYTSTGTDTKDIEKYCHPDCPCAILDRQSGCLKTGAMKGKINNTESQQLKGLKPIYVEVNASKGGASRFFKQTERTDIDRVMYIPKASNKERTHGGTVENKHCTVKPVKLIEYLCTLTKTPTGGSVLDPFAGSGTTGLACKNTGRGYILIEKEKEYIDIIHKRLQETKGETNL